MTKKTLTEYTEMEGLTYHFRVFEADRTRVEELRHRLTMANGGVPLTSAQLFSLLVDSFEAMGKFIRQEPPDSPQGQEEPK